jgi:hypothetical protein
MDAIARMDFPDLRAEYKPKAIYLEDADTVEYVKRDVACVYRRIDGILTLVLDFKSRELIGFRFKGFKNFFLKHLKPKYKLMDGDFISLVSVIEAALEVICDEVLCDQERRNAYRMVRKMAHYDRVALDDPLLMAA